MPSIILTYLKENGIPCDRKTIPGDIRKLCAIGIDIEAEQTVLTINAIHQLTKAA